MDGREKRTEKTEKTERMKKTECWPQRGARDAKGFGAEPVTVPGKRRDYDVLWMVVGCGDGWRGVREITWRRRIEVGVVRRRLGALAFDRVCSISGVETVTSTGKVLDKMAGSGIEGAVHHPTRRHGLYVRVVATETRRQT